MSRTSQGLARLRWESAQPRARPVVPDVYAITAVESGMTMRRSESTVASGTSRPASTRWGRDSVSNCQTCRSSGSLAHTEPTVITPGSSSTTTPTQAASRRIHSIWSRDDVG